ncbi:U3 snoRNP protein [Coniochaeta pulveracea]|uniref:U3 snoRNP protein n=1 Tax=Coniochaeta pulveracea TaxID=177199 RepID=A0A420YEC2_9PEZI|nr:U3 snoRNP protein [Coniochaeta pulveracea]
MPSASAGRIVKAKRNSKLTQHQKNHRWESFTSKVSKLHSLDPLRKVRRHDLDNEDLSASTSYLRNGLDKWSELNLSKNFTAFRRELAPLTDSLPQILHHQDKIMELLATYIARNDKESLEPLLDILTAFAHDLGVRFERHYPQALALIVGVAQSPASRDAEVIEFTFAALAFLFKYLARLLAPDLRATYDAVAPILGRSKVPGHVARFAAEAMSFLVKKAAAPSQKEGDALEKFVEHVRADLTSQRETRQFGLYSQGVMNMFAEAIKSAGHTIHSTAPETLAALVRAVPTEELVEEGKAIWSDVICGVLTSVVHHSTHETFGAVEKTLVEETIAAVDDSRTTEMPWRMSMFVRFFGIVAGVRRGNRLVDWSAIIKALSKALMTLSKAKDQVAALPVSLVWQHVVISTAIVWSQAPMDALIPSISDFMGTMTKEPLMRYYIPFCSYFADLNAERFRSLFQKHFQRFIMAHWSDPDNEEMLCILLPHMVESGSLPSGTEKEACALPQSWQDQIVSKFERLEITPFPERGAYDKDPKEWRDRCLPKYSALLHVLESTSVHPSTNARIAELLVRKLKLALKPSSSLATDEANFIVSHGFRACLRMTKKAGTLDMTLSPLLRAATPRFCHLLGFLEALREYESEVSASKASSSDDSGKSSPSSEAEVDPLVSSLVNNLYAPSHDLRLVSLQILDTLETTPDQKSALAIMLQVEQSPLDLQNARAISVHLRKLGQIYTHLQDGSWLQQAIPSFLFGMMTVKLSPVWDDAVEAMKLIAENGKTGEEVIANLAFEWLEVPSARWGAGSFAPTQSNRQVLTDFECLNYMRLQKTAELTSRVLTEGSEVLLETFDDGHEKTAPRPDNARTRALKVLSALPASAEKRSRKLVPYLLAWNDVNESSEDDDEENNANEEDKVEKLPEGGWSLVDRKALVDVFSKFINPKVLYQSEKVYQALLILLSNGDIEIQKLALKAILAWKQEGLKPYQESLEYLLDEARFKNELTVLFQGDNKIQPDHRAELMPVLLRLLYGRTISKKGASSGKHGLHNTRLAVIRQLNVEDMGGFLDIALGPLRTIRVVDAKGTREAAFAKEVLPVRRQVGLLNMVESIINELGTSVTSYMEIIVNAVLYCLIEACRNLREDGEDAEEDEEEGAIENKSLYKVARTTALKCLSKLFQNATSFDWTPYQETIVAEVISPRINRLAAETTQGISATWRLLGTWSVLPKPALFLAIDKRVLPSIMDILAVVKAKDEVKVYALTIVRNLVKLAVAPAEESEFTELIKSELLVPNIDLILKQVGDMLRDQPDIGRDLLETAIETVVDLAPFVENSKNARDVVDICTFLLQQPSRKVSPKIKGSILLILKNFIALDSIQGSEELKAKVYATIGPLFGYFKDKQNRETLAEVLQVFATYEPWAQEVADLCSDLNSYVERRLDEPDYNRRLSAFNVISKDGDSKFTIDQWIPLLHNMVYFICQDEEFGVLSTNSVDGITKFIEAADAGWESPEHGRYVELLSNVILPAIYAGAREQSETVRREHSRLFAALITRLGSKWTPISDLTVLVPQSEEESEHAFFFHILSPAVSKQLQAVHLLQQANEKTPLQSKNVSQFFIPLLEHFIFDRPEGGDDHGLAAQTTNALASLAISLEWQQYRAILRRYISFVDSKPDHRKQVIRLLEKLVDTLNTAIQEKRSSADAMEVDGAASKHRKLAVTVPNEEKLTEEVVNGGLPPLLKHLHDKDETTVSARVPVAIIIVKLLKLLPGDVLDSKLPGVLTDISHILRSKAWDSREMARDTLAKIARILGPEKFGFVVKELRGALTRGYQLHVLSYTLHSILVSVIPAFKQGDLDYCISSMVAVVMDDIFGITGQEKDSEDYSSSVKEVKSSKSQDSLELIAKNASIVHLGDLIQPLQAMLLEKLDLRTVRKIDDLLSRITSGLLQNPAAESRDTLVFAYEVIQDVYKKTEQTTKEQPKMDPMVRRYLVQKGAKKSDRGLTTKHTHKLVRFAIDVLRAILRKHDSLRTAANIAGFLPIIGDAVIAGEEEVKTSAFKLLTVLVKVPFKTEESANLYKVAAKEAAKIISMSPSTASDCCQAALKLISVVLRDRREIPVKDAAIDMLLTKLKDDLTEPLYRHVTFNFLRCVLDRKIETAVVYDTLDYVGTVMITNDDKDTRDLARGAFFQFLRDYPQKKNRWAKQLTFIVANLKYEREGGRLSVMEVIHLLLMKSADDFVQEVAATCFIPLIFVLANDDSEKCRLAAGKLVEEIFKRSDQEHTKKFLTLLRSWIDQEDNQAVLKLALQAFGYYFDAREGSPKDRKDVDLVVNKINDVLSEEDDWELVNASLQVLQVLVAKHPQKVLAADSQGLWAEVRECLSHENPTVRLTAIRLLSMYLADFAANSKSGATAPTGSHGLILSKEDVSDLVRLSLGILTAQEVDEPLAEEAARVLVFLGNHLEPDEARPEGEVEDSESEAEQDATSTRPEKPRTTGLRYLFWKLSTIIRKETPPKAQFLVPKTTAMSLLESFVRSSTKEQLLPSTKTILRPLRNLTDPSIPTPWSVDEVFKSRYEDLKTKATAIMDMLQSKLGTAAYTQNLLGVGQYMRDRRMKRSGKRKIEAVSAPEKFGRDKRKKFEKKKERRKMKGREHRDSRRGF